MSADAGEDEEEEGLEGQEKGALQLAPVQSSFPFFIDECTGGRARAYQGTVAALLVPVVVYVPVRVQ